MLTDASTQYLLRLVAMALQYLQYRAISRLPDCQNNPHAIILAGGYYQFESFLIL